MRALLTLCRAAMLFSMYCPSMHQDRPAPALYIRKEGNAARETACLHALRIVIESKRQSSKWELERLGFMIGYGASQVIGKTLQTP